MQFSIYDPEITTTTVVDPYGDPSGLTYVSNSSLEYWEGKFWAIMDGTTEGLVEGSAGQQIWLCTSTDGVTWEPAYQPFRDADYCNNPISGSTLEWQPNLVIVGGELWCTWCGADTYLSKLSSPTGKWTNYRFEFDGTSVQLSSTITGSAAPGWSTRATIEGHADLFGFPTQNPVVLSSGELACPVVFESFTELSTQTTATSTFIRALKWAALLKFNGNWSMTVVDTTPFGDFCAWEPFVVENPDGHVDVYVRNIDTTASDKDMMLVSRSFDGAATFEPATSTGMLVPSTRGYARKLAGRRWLMVHCDHPQNSNQTPDQTFSSNVRRNGSLFFSRSGVDDFIPGINFSEDDGSMNYPQFTVRDGAAYINYTSGTGVGVRRSLRVVKVDPTPTDEVAYIHPRSVNAFTAISDPQLVSDTPPYFYFNGANKAVSTGAVAATSGLTYTAWLEWNSESDVIVDTRNSEGTAGQVFLIRGLAIRGLNFLHGQTLLPNLPVFLAAVVDNSALTVTVYVGSGGVFSTKVGHFRSLLMSGLPADGDTVTVDGSVYTFRAAASLPSEVQIGASVSATVGNLASKLDMYKDTPGSGRLILARFDTEAFTVSSGSAQVSVESSIPLDGGVAVVGRAANQSSLSTLSGRIYDARVYDSALTVEHLTYLHNTLAADLGHTPVAGTSTDPGTALLRYSPDDHSQFPPSGVQVGHCETVNSNLLRIHGEGSASVELPYPVSRVQIRFKLSAAPAGSDKFVIATLGTVESPLRIYVSAENSTKLHANGREVAAIDPTSYAAVTVDVFTDKAIVGPVEHYFSGKPRCFLGSAYPENLLADSKSIDFDVSAMTVTATRSV